MYHQLIYVSKRPIEVSKLSLGPILKTCRRRNPVLGLTGVLLSESRHFFQVLEGKESKVKDTFKRICLDPRHTDVQIYLERKKAKRDFAEWWMAFREIDTIDQVDNCFELSRDRIMRRVLVEADEIMHGLVMDFLALCRAENRGDVELFCETPPTAA